MKLHTSIGPNPRVVKMFLAEKGLEIPFVTVDLMGGENRREPYNAQVNTAGQTPAHLSISVLDYKGQPVKGDTTITVEASGGRIQLPGASTDEFGPGRSDRDSRRRTERHRSALRR